MLKKIRFSPPSITEEDINEVVEVLRSGWITTGAKVKEFENLISAYCGSQATLCTNSATSALHLALHLLGIGKGDEVIVSSYTYTASAACICHVGATPVIIDTAPDSFFPDYEALAAAVTPRTKAIIAVDLAGILCDYDRLFLIAESKRRLFSPSSPLQSALGRIAIIADAAHAFGAARSNTKCGNIADFTAFSFHAVKNITTAEGGALTWRRNDLFSGFDFYRRLKNLSLHGQTKDAAAKFNGNSWEYDVEEIGFKFNMPDMAAALALRQLKRYNEILSHRKRICEIYRSLLDGSPLLLIDHFSPHDDSAFHLAMISIEDLSLDRDRLFERMRDAGIPCNVHYKPLPLLTAYREMGFSPARYPNAMRMYRHELTLPLHNTLDEEDAIYIATTLKQLL